MTASPGAPAGPGSSPTTFTARCPEDLLAAVPVVLGFVPHDSVVMLTFGAVHAFHARVDLPDHEDDLPTLVSSLLEPAVRHGVPQAMFVVYSTEPGAARLVADALVVRFGEAGVEVIDVLRADGRRWHPLLRHRPGVPAAGVPYDVSAHPFVVESVVEGRVTHGSREELAQALRPDPAAVDALASMVSTPPPGEPELSEEAGWVRRLVESRTAAEDGSRLECAEAARLLHDLTDLRLRDVAWATMSRDNAPRQVGFWTDLVRRAPAPLVAAPSALLGFAAWLAGHGALAWCALDRCGEADPRYGLADILGMLLTQAVAPTLWDEDWVGEIRAALEQLP